MRLARARISSVSLKVDIFPKQPILCKSGACERLLFIDDLGFDSLDTVQLVMDLEEEFDISIPDEDAEELLQVGQAIEYIKEQVD